MNKYSVVKLEELILKANTGADAIKRAPIVPYDSGIRCLRIQDISQKKSYSDWGFCKVNDRDRTKFLLRVNDIMIARTGETIGCNLIIKENLEAVYNNGLIKITVDKKKCHPLYAYYNISSQLFSSYIDNVGRTTSTQPNLKINVLLNFKIALPSLFEQQQIAQILSAYDDLIETNNQRIVTLEQLAQQIYKEWFVRMRFPGWETTPFHHGIPDGWRIENFDKFCLLQRGFDLPDQEIKNGLYPVMASTTIKAYHNAYKVEPPVITTGRSGSLGTVLFSYQKAWPLNTALFVKNFYNNSPYLIFYTLKNLGLENFNAGAGVPSLNRNHLQAIKIKVPSKAIQNQFDKIISGIFEQKVVLEESNAILEKTRNLLLPRLISGKLTIKQAEAIAVNPPD